MATALPSAILSFRGAGDAADGAGRDGGNFVGDAGEGPFEESHGLGGGAAVRFFRSVVGPGVKTDGGSIGLVESEGREKEESPAGEQGRQPVGAGGEGASGEADPEWGDEAVGALDGGWECGVAGPADGRGVGVADEVEVEIGRLGDEHHADRDPDDDRSLAAGIDHEGGEPAAEAVGPGGHGEEKAEGGKREEHKLGAASEGEADDESGHRGRDEDEAERDVGREVIDEEGFAERDRKVHEPGEVDDLGALELARDADDPEEKKDRDDDVPNQKQHVGRGFAQRRPADENAGGECREGGKGSSGSQEGGDDGTETAVAGPLVDCEPPTEPEDGAELGDVHADEYEYALTRRSQRPQRSQRNPGEEGGCGRLPFAWVDDFIRRAS